MGGACLPQWDDEVVHATARSSGGENHRRILPGGLGGDRRRVVRAGLEVIMLDILTMLRCYDNNIHILHFQGTKKVIKGLCEQG